MLPQPLTFILAELAVRERQLEIDRTVRATQAARDTGGRGSVRPVVADLVARLTRRSGIRAAAKPSPAAPACCAPSTT